jgi:competence protein ComEC
VRKASLAVLFLLAGCVLGRIRIAIPATRVFRNEARIVSSLPVAVSGRLSDFWTPRGEVRRTRIAIREVRQSDRELSFPADATIWLSGDAPTPAGRGDDVEVTGILSRRDLPASTRDVLPPYPEFSLSVKSAMQVSRRRQTLESFVFRPNEFLARRLSQSNVSRDEVQAPVSALLLGRIAELDDGTTRRFRRGGLYHLWVISGLHVGLLVTLVALALGPLSLSRKARDTLLVGTALVFALATGGSAPAIRGALMISIFLLSRIVEKPVAVLQAAGLSAILIVLAEPKELWSAGFYLTYAAVGGIAILAAPLRELLRGLPGWLGPIFAVAVAAQLATAPLLLWRFNLVNPVAWILSPLVVLLLSCLLGSGVLVLLASAVKLPVGLFAAAFQVGERVLSRLAEGSAGTVIAVPTPPLSLAILLLALLIVSARAPRLGRRVAAAGFAAVILFLVFRRPGRIRGTAFIVELLDVGQGDAILLRSEGGAFLVDGGGTFEANAEEFGRTRLLPKLYDRGIVGLDGVLLSHSHPDHALGLFAVLRELSVSKFFRGEGSDENGFYSRLEAVARVRNVRQVRLAQGDRIPWRGGAFIVLRSGGSPFKTDPVNNGSLVVAFEKGKRRVLLTGDAGAPAERELLDARPGLLRADLLKIGHHGSRTSSLPEFVSAVSPRAALISCGRNNRFHHPSPATLETLRALHVPVFRTDQRSDIGILVLPAHLLLFERGLR